MPVVSRLLRKAPGAVLKQYFEQRSIEFPEPVDWHNAGRILIEVVRKVIDSLPDTDNARIRIDAERVDRMASEIGQTALMGVATAEQRVALCNLGTRHGRALWLLVDDPERFRRADDASFFENARRGRTWDGFVAPKGLQVDRRSACLDTFAEEIRRLFEEGRKVKVELFDRSRTDLEGNIKELVQVTVYREGLLDSVDAFEGDEPGPLVYNPAHELAMTYEPASGVIEVIAPRKAQRAELAALFAKVLLGHAIEGGRVPIRHFDLSVFMEERELDFDPRDGIEEAWVQLVKVQSLDTGLYLSLERATREVTLHAAAELKLGEQNPFRGGWRPIEVLLAIHFRPDAVNPRGVTITIKLRDPNGSDLKDKSEKHRLISEKYLPLWRVVRDLAA